MDDFCIKSLEKAESHRNNRIAFLSGGAILFAERNDNRANLRGSFVFLGVIGAKISGVSLLRDGFKMAFVGGIAIIVGILAGNLLSKI